MVVVRRGANNPAYFIAHMQELTMSRLKAIAKGGISLHLIFSGMCKEYAWKGSKEMAQVNVRGFFESVLGKDNVVVRMADKIQMDISSIFILLLNKFSVARESWTKQNRKFKRFHFTLTSLMSLLTK